LRPISRFLQRFALAVRRLDHVRDFSEAITIAASSLRQVPQPVPASVTRPISATSWAPPAIAFTNQIQIRHLNMVAEGMGLGDDLANALTRRVVVASIGPSCSHQLRQLGIQPMVVPPTPKMRPLISSLTDYFSYVRAS
jgi:hypothetical protein